MLYKLIASTNALVQYSQLTLLMILSPVVAINSYFYQQIFEGMWLEFAFTVLIVSSNFGCRSER